MQEGIRPEDAHLELLRIRLVLEEILKAIKEKFDLKGYIIDREEGTTDD